MVGLEDGAILKKSIRKITNRNRRTKQKPTAGSKYLGGKQIMPISEFV